MFVSKNDAEHQRLYFHQIVSQDLLMKSTASKLNQKNKKKQRNKYIVANQKPKDSRLEKKSPSHRLRSPEVSFKHFAETMAGLRA